MELSPDDLAGVVDLFGALRSETLRQALSELAFKRGEDREPAAFDELVSVAIESYHVLEIDDGPDTLLVPGPVAFPTLPEDAIDLQHILDVEQRTMDRDRLADAAERRFRADASQAVAAGDRDRMEELLDVSYELEAWAPVDLTTARERLDTALEGNNSA